MKIAVMAFTENGYLLEKRICVLLSEGGHQVESFFKSKYMQLSPDSMVKRVEGALGAWADEYFLEQEAVIFIGAAGIAVRTIAPYVKSKRTDPAVVVLDEKGQFCIPILSGHLGGANALALELAEGIKAQAVITTATDVNHHFAVDVFAAKNHLWISDMRLAKEVSALILRGESLTCGAGEGFAGSISVKELDFVHKTAPDGKKATFWIQLPSGEVLHLVPKNICVGIGCRKGVGESRIEEHIQKTLQENGIFREAVFSAASIDLKKDEQGIKEFCEKWKMAFVTFDEQELRQAKGAYTASEFVSSVMGVDNVCERSSFLASGEGSVIIKKQAHQGVTAACAVKRWSVDFE